MLGHYTLISKTCLIYILTFPNQGFGCAFTLTGTWTKTPPGNGGSGGTKRWNSQYDYTSVARISLSVSSSTVFINGNTTATVTLFGGQDATNYSVTPSSDSPSGGQTRIGRVTVSGMTPAPGGNSIVLTTQNRTGTATVTGAEFGYLRLKAACSNAGNSPQYQDMTVTLDPTNDPTKRNTLTPAQLAQLLNLSPDEARILTAGCIGCTAAQQGQAPVESPQYPGVFGPMSLPENYNVLATGTKTEGYANKATADAAAANAPAGSTVTEFQKQGGAPDANGNPTSTQDGPYDYTTVVNVNGTNYYVDANHADIPAGSARFYATTTPPKEPTPGNPNGGYTTSRWYVTVTPRH